MRCLAILLMFLLAPITIAAAPVEVPPPPPVPPEAGAVWLGVLLGNAVDGGAQVLAVVPRGPAANAGLIEGDVILALDGRPTPDRVALGRVVDQLRPGARVQLTVLRGKENFTRLLQVAKRVGPVVVPLPERVGVPEAELEPPGWSGWSGGMTLAAIPRELRVHYGAPAGAGVLVTSVDPEGAAAAAGVKVGDVLVHAGSLTISDPPELIEALLSSGGDQAVPLELVRDRKPVRVDLRSANPFSAAIEAHAMAETAAETEAPVAIERYRALMRGEGTEGPRARIERLEEEIQRLAERLAELEDELARVKKEN